MTPGEFAAEIVVPTVREFRDNRRSRRHAYLACLTAYHLKDHLKSVEADVESAMKVYGPSRSFEAVRSVCTATKHVEFAGSRSEHIPFRIGDDFERPPCVAGQAVPGLSRVGDPIGGRECVGLDLYDCVKTVLMTYEFHFEVMLGSVDFRDC
jgi:hypothetical protein